MVYVLIIAAAALRSCIALANCRRLAATRLSSLSHVAKNRGLGASRRNGSSRRAMACALDMRRAAHTFGTFVQNTFNTDLSVGIAVHSGPAIVGQLGYFRNRQFNAIGDVLNVTSRLENLNKECGTDLSCI